MLATDGLWDVLDGEEAVRVVDSLLKDGKAPQECCAELVARTRAAEKTQCSCADEAETAAEKVSLA